MRAARLTSGWPLTAAFTIWFAHFMLCWAAVEIWPQQWQANLLAWMFTALALLALGAYGWRLVVSEPGSQLGGWTRRLGLGATAIAAVAVVFSAVPSLFFLP